MSSIFFLGDRVVRTSFRGREATLAALGGEREARPSIISLPPRESWRGQGGRERELSVWEGHPSGDVL